MKAIYKYTEDFGRIGELEAIFIEEQNVVQYAIENKLDVYFGEVLGKHSEVIGTLSQKNITEITSDQTMVKMFEKNNLSCGSNPFEDPICNREDEGFGDDPVSEYISYKLTGKRPN